MSVSQIRENDKISHLHLPFPPYVEENDSLEQAIQIMQKKRVGCIPICQDLKIVGVFTERDYLLRILNKNVDIHDSVMNWMTKKVITANPDDSIRHVIETMATHDIRHIPLVDQEKNLVGLVSVRNIVDFLVQYNPDEVYNLPPNLEQIHKTTDGG